MKVEKLKVQDEPRWRFPFPVSQSENTWVQGRLLLTGCGTEVLPWPQRLYICLRELKAAGCQAHWPWRMRQGPGGRPIPGMGAQQVQRAWGRVAQSNCSSVRGQQRRRQVET